MELSTDFRGLNDTNGGVRGSVWLFKAKVSKMVTFPSPIEYDFDLQTLNFESIHKCDEKAKFIHKNLGARDEFVGVFEGDDQGAITWSHPFESNLKMLYQLSKS
jgi:hypothetical protein